MAQLGSGILTLADVAKRLDPDGKPAVVAELLEQVNPIIQDIPFIEGNLPTGHQSTIRTGLPSVYWRAVNQGIAPSKSTTAQVTDACGMLEAWSEVDCVLADLSGDVNKFRFNEAKPFIEAMGQEFVQTLIYGNVGTAPEEFNGLSMRYSSTTAANGQNIVTGGGSSSDNTSIWLIGWGENTIHGIYPKGSIAGLQHEDLGKVTVETTAGLGASGGRMRAYQDHFVWRGGIVVKDWRYAVRAPNIDVSALVTKSSAADLFDIMIKMTHRLINPSLCRPVFYMNRSVFQMLDIQARDDVTSGGQLKYEMVSGKVQTSFRGIPVKICDQILENESVVS